ncbi:MAG: hypothetical protein R3B40_14385 [Polyangiales bacterium]
MPTLVHLAPEHLHRRITRSGLRGGAWSLMVGGQRVSFTEAVFAMPVLSDFSVTHQWLRELRRHDGRRFIGVYFRLPAETEVYVGRFGQEHRALPLGASVAAVRDSPAGAQIVIPKRIAASSIRAIRSLRQDVGWVETPEATTHYDCVCRMCLRPGTPNLIRRVRACYLSGMRHLATAETDVEALRALGVAQGAIERGRDRLPVEALRRFAQHPSPVVRKRIAHLLSLCGRPATHAATVGEP